MPISLLFVAASLQRHCCDRDLQSLKYLLPGPLQKKLADAWNKLQLKVKQCNNSRHLPSLWKKNQYRFISVYLAMF